MIIPGVTEHLTNMRFEPIFAAPEWATRIRAESMNWEEVIGDAQFRIDRLRPLE